MDKGKSHYASIIRNQDFCGRKRNLQIKTTTKKVRKNSIILTWNWKYQSDFMLLLFLLKMYCPVLPTKRLGSNDKLKL